MKTNIGRIFFSCLVVVVGTLLWKYTGIGDAVNYQNEIRENGFYYEGQTFMTQYEINTLKDSLSERDKSIQTSSDLEILPKIEDEKILVRYSFLSPKIYEKLETKEFPSSIKYGLNFIPTMGPILYFSIVLMWAFSVLVGK